jgi:hypothetical protein
VFTSGVLLAQEMRKKGPKRDAQRLERELKNDLFIVLEYRIFNFVFRVYIRKALLCKQCSIILLLMFYVNLYLLESGFAGLFQNYMLRFCIAAFNHIDAAA